MFVAGPCEFLVMYGFNLFFLIYSSVAGPCEFLVMYGYDHNLLYCVELQDPVNF